MHGTLHDGSDHTGREEQVDMQSANPGIATMEHRGTVVGRSEHDNPPRLGALAHGDVKRQ